MKRYAGKFDEHMALEGTPAIFVYTHEDEWRFSEELTRDVWERQEGEVDRAPGFALLRDRRSGFVSRCFTGSLQLLAEHPRADVLPFESEAVMVEALRSIGRPTVLDAEGWTGFASKWSADHG